MDDQDRLTKALAGRYRIEREIGRGGMATVFLAQDLKHNRQVAVKVLASDLAQDLGPERFLREIETVANLTHPHILPLFDSGEEGGFLFYVMPYMKGESLRVRLTREKQLPVEDAIQVTREIADALAYAHGEGVVHRDVKPANIMLEAGHAILADFGVAYAVAEAKDDRITQTSTSLGTPAYMSPEQASGEQDLDGRSDQYALGCVLYEMLAGHPPFTGAKVEAVVRQHLTQEPPSVVQARPSVAEEIANIIDRTLAKNPADRFKTTGEMAAALALTMIPSLKGPGRVPKARGVVLSLAAAAVLAIGVTSVLRGGRESGDPRDASRLGAMRDEKPSIAVLPCENRSPDPDDEFLAAALHDEILLKLQGISSLYSTGRASVQWYRENPAPLAQIAEELGVGFVGDCSVQKYEDQIRVIFQLLEPDGVQVWADDYDRNLTVENLFDIQSDVARQIAQAIGAMVTPEEQVRIETPPTDDLEAYNAYLLGRVWWNRRTEEGIQRAIEYFEHAIQGDNAFALAYAGLSDCYASLGYYSVLTPTEGYTKAKEMASRALGIDNTLAEAHTSLGGALLYFDWDWAGAEEEFRRAIELNPRYATAHQWYGSLFWVRGQLDESMNEVSVARQLDPLSSIINREVGKQHYFARRYDDAIDALTRTIDLDPDFFLAHWYLGRTLVQQNRFDEAVDALERAVVLSSQDPFQIAALAHAHAVSGNENEALRLLDALQEESHRRYVSPYGIAEVYVGLGDNESAFQWLERAYEGRSPYLIYLKVEPRLDPLRSDPRFTDLMARMGLSGY
jgi:TolB-like protein/Tfp pilus assembly protein PilF